MLQDKKKGYYKSNRPEYLIIDPFGIITKVFQSKQLISVLKFISS